MPFTTFKGGVRGLQEGPISEGRRYLRLWPLAGLLLLISGSENVSERPTQ